VGKAGHRRFRSRGIAGRNGGQREAIDTTINMFGDDFADSAEPGDGDPLHSLASVIHGSVPRGAPIGKRGLAQAE
jgi:hypothetical protein